MGIKRLDSSARSLWLGMGRYCRFYNGRRTDDDKRQIQRWLSLAGPNGRFRKALINKIKDKNTKFNDESISPVIRQTLQQWGYRLTQKDFNTK